jgi:hypothetical protein
MGLPVSDPTTPVRAIDPRREAEFGRCPEPNDAQGHRRRRATALAGWLSRSIAGRLTA